MAGVSVADCTSLHVDFVVRPGSVHGGTWPITMEVCVFARSFDGDLRVLGRAGVPFSAPPPGADLSANLRVAFDPWEGVLRVGAGDGHLLALEVRWCWVLGGGVCGEGGGGWTW